MTIFVGPDRLSSGAEYYLDPSADVEEALRRIEDILRGQGGGVGAEEKTTCDNPGRGSEDPRGNLISFSAP